MTALPPIRRTSTGSSSPGDRHPYHRASDVGGARQPGAARRAPVRRAFTLIELLVVVAIIGILVTFAAPKIDIQRFRVNSAVQALGTTILSAQRQAVTDQHDIIVLFDSTANRIRIHEDGNNNGVINTGEHVRFVSLGEAIVFGRGPAPAMPFGTSSISIVKRIGGTPALVFHRDGSASEVGGFYVTSALAQRSSIRATDARAVSVERATGRASWFRYGGSAWVKLF
ncbi:MAG: GspH/FimT family pseudopilin [Gemmatimonadaceae bacterium]